MRTVADGEGEHAAGQECDTNRRKAAGSKTVPKAVTRRRGGLEPQWNRLVAGTAAGPQFGHQ